MRVHDSTVLRTGSESIPRAWQMAVTSPARGKVQIQIKGELDMAGARRVVEVLAHAAAASIHIDLSPARQIEDGALAYLSERLRELASSVTIGGLGRHHQRLLRLLGREQMIEPANRE